MKVFFWIMWVIIVVIELFLIKGLINTLFQLHPLDASSLTSMIFFILIGACLITGSYYWYRIGKLKWACLLLDLPLIALVFYVVIFLFLPLLMGERMN
ncbi:MAG: hypothetical protein H0W62_07905 [Chitinophagales bacterium]|nr:hypothetical protein [Chitinophagales bacterium]